jgi:hypothetical protein
VPWSFDALVPKGKNVANDNGYGAALLFNPLMSKDVNVANEDRQGAE